MTLEQKTEIRRAVRNYFGEREFVYANPNTENFMANFYGDTPICQLSQQDVFDCIETAYESWNWDEEIYNDALDAAITTVLGELQYDRPEE